jgi:TolA-binding protein
VADAARYTQRSDLAERCLLAIRQRAAAGPQRAAAAFLLGRTDEAIGRFTAANTWYQTYLAESPNGEFAADSLAGALRATARLRGNAAARPLAMQYLQRYPNGVHAATARKTLQGN